MNPIPPSAAPSHPAATPLARWLARYISQRRRFIAGTGLAVAATSAGLAALGFSLADALLTLPPWLRWVALASTIGLVVWLAAAALRRAAALQRRQAMDEIEAMLPAQGQLMRTALEETETPRSSDPVHALLTEGLMGQASKLASRFHPDRHLPWPRLRRRWAVAAGLVAGMLALATAWPDFRTAVRRFWQPSAALTFTRIQFVDPPREILAGNDCRLVVRVSGRRADAPSLSVRRGEALDPPVPMTADPDSPGVYILSLGKPGAALTVRATSGDGTTEEHTIAVVYPPKLKDFTAELAYPEYTGLPPASQKSPDIEAVEGTRVAVALTTDRPLTSGHVEFSDGSTTPVDINGEAISFTATLQRGALTWKLAATDSRGLTPPAAGGKWIGLEDKPPKIEWVTPKNDIEATPLAEVTLRAKVKDDFGLLQTGVVIQAGGKERTLHTRDFDGSDGVPVSAVMETLAELERENTTIRDNVKIFAFARDRFPAPTGRERRGVSDLRNIDIRQFKVWRAMVNGGGSSPPPPKAQKALMKLDQIVKQQRAIVNTVFRYKEENIREESACHETADTQRNLGAGTAELKEALLQSEFPPPPDDQVLLDTATQQMGDAAGALDSVDVPAAWTSADGALTSLLELRREFMKLMSRNGQPCDCEPKPDDFQMPSLTELAKEAERLAQEEDAVAKGVPLTRDNTVEGDKLASRQASAQSDAGELFDSIVTHPEVTELAQSRMGQAEKSMAAATQDLRGRRTEAALPSLQAAQESLSRLAQHLRGLDATQAAPTLMAAADMAQQSANEMKRAAESPGSTSGSGEGASTAPGSPGSPAPSPEKTAAENAATINDWLKTLARQESLGRTAERLGALQRESGIEALAEKLAGLATPARAGADSSEPTLENQAAADQLGSLAQALSTEHQRMVQSTLEKLAAAQAATRAQRAAGSADQPPSNSTAPAISSARPGSLKFAQDLADLLGEFKDTELTELSSALIRELAEQEYNRNVDSETLGKIEARLEALIQDVIQRQILAGKSDRVPPEYEARVENYFRRLSEDTGEDEVPEDDAAMTDPAAETDLQPAFNNLRSREARDVGTPPVEIPFASPGFRLLPDQ